MSKFDAVDFSECRTKELMFHLTLSVFCFHSVWDLYSHNIIYFRAWGNIIDVMSQIFYLFHILPLCEHMPNN